MILQYKPTYFKIEELVSEKTLLDCGEARCWWLFDSRILEAADLLREQFGVTIVNDWHTGGKFKDSGYRVPTYSRYSITSQHSNGRALDLKFKRHTADEVREGIIADRERYHMITGLEMGVNWVHIDCRNYDGLFQFYPAKQTKGKKTKENKDRVRDLR